MVHSAAYSKILVVRTGSLILYCIVPSRNLQGLPKHLNGHPRVSEQNLLPQNMVWRTRKIHDHQKTRLWKDHGFGIRPHQDFPARSRPHQTPQGGEGGRGIPTHQTPHHRGKEGGFPPTRPHTTERSFKTTRRGEGGGFPDIWGGGGATERVTIYTYACYIHPNVYTYTYRHKRRRVYTPLYSCLYVLMYVCMYVCMHVCMHALCVCMYLFIYLSIYLSIYLCVQTCMQIRMYVHISVCKYVVTHVHRFIHIHALPFTYLRIYRYTYICIYRHIWTKYFIIYMLYSYRCKCMCI